MVRFAFPILALILAAPLAAEENLGVFSGWGAFGDPAVPQCYAIAEALPSRARRDFQPYATVASWPARRIGGQVHFRLSREIRTTSRVSLRVGRARFSLTPGKADAWARDAAMDRAIASAMRQAETMTITATDTAGRSFSDSYRLAGAATAIDASAVACRRR